MYIYAHVELATHWHRDETGIEKDNDELEWGWRTLLNREFN